MIEETKLHDTKQEQETLTGLNNCKIEHKLIAGAASLIISVLFLVLLLAVLAHSIKITVDISAVQSILALPQQEYLKPEPLERLLFVCGVLVLPVFLLVFYSLAYRLIERVEEGRIISRLYLATIYAMVAMVSLLAWIDCREDKYYFFNKSVATGFFAVSVLGIFTFSVSHWLVSSEKKSRLIASALEILSVVTIILIALFCIYDLNAISHTGRYIEHLNAVLHAVVQVYHGKELLFDLSHQYGMYPHFLEPVFKVTGLSVLRFTTVMGLLLGLSLFLIYKFLKEITENSVVALLGFCSVVYYGYVFLRVNFQFDQYFQYHPIRLLFPALSIYLTYKYLKTNDKKIYYLSFVACSMAVLWNFDTGFVVFMSWLLMLLFKEMYSCNYKNMLYHVFKGLTVFTLFLSTFTLYMYLRYGHVPDYRSFIDYQKIFYKYGYAMIPMELIAPWHLVIMIYAIGLLYSIAAITGKIKNESIKVPMVFFLSILGTGLFAYFQGRSHDLNLASVCYPAIIIMTLFADSLLPFAKKDKRFHNRLIFIGILSFFIFSTVSLVKNLPEMAADSAGRLRLAINRDVTPYTLKTEFLKNNIKSGDEVLILSSISSIYYLASGTTNPVKIPGSTELFLIEEYQKIYDYLQSDRCRFIVFDGDFIHSNPYKKELVDFIAARFDVLSTPDEGMYILAKR